MSFKINDNVYVKTLKKEGVVSEILGGENYKVAIGSLSMHCKGQDLEPITAKAKEDSSSPINPRKAYQVKYKRVLSTSLDLHGKTVDEALALTEKAISDAILEGTQRLEIIHGLGSGRLERAIHGYLSKSRVISNYKLDERNPGTTMVFF